MSLIFCVDLAVRQNAHIYLSEEFMKYILMIAVVVAVLSPMQNVLGEVPQMLNYQGRLTDQDGTPVDTTVSILFTIYDDSTGGTVVWTETQPAVTVTSGLFNVLLGSINPIQDTVFAEPDRYLDIRIGSNPAIIPRTKLAAVAYAHRVSTVDGSAGGLIDGGTFIGKLEYVVPMPCLMGGGDCEPGPDCQTPNTTIHGTLGGAITDCGRVYVTDGYQKTIDLDGGSGDVSACGKALFGERHFNYGDFSFVAGCDNTVNVDYSTVSGGQYNNSGGIYSNIGGGQSNQAMGDHSTISGGQGNETQSGQSHQTIGGGLDNNSEGNYSSIGGGLNNQALGEYSTIGGGQDNDTQGGYDHRHQTIGGGLNNSAHYFYSTVAGGQDNVADGSWSAIGGGVGNICGGGTSTIAGGSTNQTGGSGASVGGGAINEASGYFPTVPGGYQNQALGDYSFAAGRRAKALHDGAFVWADQTNADIQSAAINRFSVRASGGIYLYTNSTLTSGMHLLAGGSAWIAKCDSTLKQNIREVNYQKILEKVAELPISQWSYKAQDESIEHIGPMAQDFYRLFGLGEDDKHICTLDPDGVALAAIKGLYQRSQKQKAQIEEKTEEITALKAELSRLTELVEVISAQQKNTDNADLAASK
jgi:hypothetical protein